VRRTLVLIVIALFTVLDVHEIVYASIISF
jgi:hypothetical protein